MRARARYEVVRDRGKRDGSGESDVGCECELGSDGA